MAKRGGQPGNQNSAKGTMVRDALRKVAAQNPEKLRKACEAVLDKAVEGDMAAFAAFRDTLDGKPSQSIDLSTRNESNPGRNLDDSELSEIISTGSSGGTAGETDSEEKPGGLH